MLLFLGAGASKPFDMPLMDELTDIVLNKLKTENINHSVISLIDNLIKKRVEDFKIKPDIEAVLTCIDALCNPEKGIQNAGPFAALISDQRSADKLTFGVSKKDWCKCSKKCREIIRHHCFFPSEENKEKLEKIYDNLFQIFNINNSNPLNVFTTNYDLCFERYCKIKNIKLYDCFDDRERFDPEFRGANGWQLYKLHGSAHWIVTEDCETGEFTKVDYPIEVGEQTLKGKMATDVMIYPATEKYYSKTPYFELLNRFRTDLKNSKIGDRGLCVVIGYSFRDIPINNAFTDAFQNEKSKCIIYIDEDPTTNIENNIPELVDVIEPINQSFGKNLYLRDFPYYIQQLLKYEWGEVKS